MRYGNSREGMSEEKAAKRNRKRRDRMRDLGLRPMQVWVKPKHRKKVRAYVAKLLAR